MSYFCLGTDHDISEFNKLIPSYCRFIAAAWPDWGLQAEGSDASSRFQNRAVQKGESNDLRLGDSRATDLRR